jgi:GNAT superfamily N-acetyltransferase
MDIEFTNHPQSIEIDFLTRKINEETIHFGAAYPFAFLIRDESNEVIAGCNGSVIFGSIYTDQLWVHPHYRNKGFGRTLVNTVHEYGRQNGCTIATVATMSFQEARRFYEKLGYAVDFERKGYISNSSCIFMKRSL